MFSKIAGPNPIYPFLGNIPQLIKYRDYRMYHMYDALVEKYGPLVYIQAGRLSQSNLNFYTFSSISIDGIHLNN